MTNTKRNLPDFNEDEIFYKEAFQCYPDAHLNQAQSLHSISKSCPAVAHHISPLWERRPADALKEHDFPEVVDVSVERHFRYSPAFLHSHSFFEIVIVCHGNCENVFGTETLHMKTGEICIIAPGTVHALSAFHDDCVIYNLLVRSTTFEQTFLNSLPQQGILYSFFSKALFVPGAESYLYFKNSEDEYLFHIFEQILQEYTLKNAYYNSLINALLTTFFIQLLRQHEKDVIVPNPSGKKQEENMIFILKYIELHAESITLKELADFFNYSERQMSRILKDYTGQTFTGLIQSTRMVKACSLLKHPDIPINDIIESIGYSNATHFYDVFKKMYNITPAQYRQQYTQEINIV